MARPNGGAFSLELFHQKNSFRLQGKGPFLVESDSIALRHDEGYSGGVNGWATLRYISVNSINYAPVSVLDLTGRGVEIGLSRNWNFGKGWQIAAQSDYEFELLNSNSESDTIRLGWHTATAQLNLLTELSNQWTINIAILTQVIDGFLKQRDVEPLSIKADDYIGSSVGVAWEIEPTGIITVTAIHFVETSIRIQFIRTYDTR